MINIESTRLASENKYKSKMFMLPGYSVISTNTIHSNKLNLHDIVKLFVSLF